ncbi:MAG: restriction endonuclease subunit S, partial [Candidatus Jacksonbacteria bacterium]
LFYILQFDIFADQVKRLSLGGSQPNISPNSIEEIKIPLPPLQTQTKIVSIMQKAYQEKKEKEEQARKLLESIDDYVLGELGIKMPKIQKEMVFEVASDKVENSRIDAQYWQPFLEKIEQAINNGQYKTQKLKNFITKIHYGASTSNAYADDGIPFLRILNLKPNHFNLSDVMYLPEDFRKELGNAFVKAGDLLISRSGTVGIVSVVPKEADGFAFGSFMIKFCLNNKEINKEFVSIWLNNKLNKLLTEREKIGAIQGNITISTIENFTVPIPLFSTQSKIAEKVKSIYSQAQKLKKDADDNLQTAKKKVEQMILG